MAEPKRMITIFPKVIEEDSWTVLVENAGGVNASAEGTMTEVRIWISRNAMPGDRIVWQNSNGSRRAILMQGKR